MLDDAQKLNEDDLQVISGGAYTGYCSRYTVKNGDTLQSIALKKKTTVDALCSINCIFNPNTLSVGTTILIPR